MGFSFWQFGFGWKTVFIFLTFGLATYNSTGWLHWIFYALFVVVLAYMLTKFRLYRREPWRWIHSYGIHLFAGLAREELDLAKKENRQVADIDVLCKKLASKLLGTPENEHLTETLLSDHGRKAYYLELVDNYPLIFMRHAAAEKQKQALAAIKQDIEASKLGPDIIIALAIEKRYGKMEAARYLLAVATGVTKRHGVFV